MIRSGYSSSHSLMCHQFHEYGLTATVDGSSETGMPWQYMENGFGGSRRRRRRRCIRWMRWIFETLEDRFSFYGSSQQQQLHRMTCNIANRVGAISNVAMPNP
jgi:hypothetical protein